MSVLFWSLNLHISDFQLFEAFTILNAEEQDLHSLRAAPASLPPVMDAYSFIPPRVISGTWEVGDTEENMQISKAEPL